MLRIYSFDRILLSVSLSVLLPSGAYALDPAAVRVGGVSVTPELTLEERYTDNLFNRPDDTLDTWYSVVSPSVTSEYENNLYVMEVKLQNMSGFYEKSSDDDYSDNLVSGKFGVKFNHRNNLTLTAGYDDRHEARGTGLTEGDLADVISEPLEYEISRLGARYVYGAQSSRGRLEFKAGSMEKEYQNFSQYTDRRNYDELSTVATFYYKVGGRTDWLISYGHRDMDYTTDPVSEPGVYDTRDAQTQNVSTGFTWTTSAQVESRAKVGYIKRTFDDRDRVEFDGLNWDVDVTWSPVERSAFILKAGREDRETNGQGSFVDSKMYSLGWDHSWASRLSTELSYEYRDNDYVGDDTGREEKISSYEFEMTHNFRRWMDVRLKYEYRDKDASSVQYEYSRNVFSVGIDVSL